MQMVLLTFEIPQGGCNFTSNHTYESAKSLTSAAKNRLDFIKITRQQNQNVSKTNWILNHSRKWPL